MTQPLKDDPLSGPFSVVTNTGNSLMIGEAISRLTDLNQKLDILGKDLKERLQRMEDLLDDLDSRLVELDLPYR